MRSRNTKKQSKRTEHLAFDTKISTIGKEFGVDFGVGSDKKLGDFLIEKGYKSLADMFQRA